MSLSHIVSIIVEQFLPEQHRKYLFLNVQMDPTYRAYNTHVPSYLQGRPRNVIIHCLVREEKAKKNSHLKTSHQQIRKLVSSLFVANQGTSTQLTLELKQENRTVLVKTGRKITFLVNTSFLYSLPQMSGVGVLSHGVI